MGLNGRDPDASDRENYTVMDTDYENFSIVYSCKPIWWGFASQEYLWILTRDPEPTDEYIDSLVKQIIEQKLPDYEFYENTVKTPQGDDFCQYDQRKA